MTALDAGNHCSRHSYSSDLHQIPGSMSINCPEALSTGGRPLGMHAIQGLICICSMNAKSSLEEVENVGSYALHVVQSENALHSLRKY